MRLNKKNCNPAKLNKMIKNKLTLGFLFLFGVMTNTHEENGLTDIIKVINDWYK